MSIFGLVPLKASRMKAMGLDIEALEPILESRISEVTVALSERFAVFTDHAPLIELCEERSWPLLRRDTSREPGDSPAEALASAMDSVESQSLAWISPFSVGFSSRYMIEMCDLWEKATNSDISPPSLIAVTVLRGWAFLDGRELNFDSSEFNLNSREVIPIEFTNLPFSIISRRTDSNYSLVSPESVKFAVPFGSMVRLMDTEEDDLFLSQLPWRPSD